METSRVLGNIITTEAVRASADLRFQSPTAILLAFILLLLNRYAPGSPCAISIGILHRALSDLSPRCMSSWYVMQRRPDR